MAKHGVVTVDPETGAVALKEGTGIVNYVADALTTIFSSQKVAVGHAATVQKIALVAAGNIAGVQSATGMLGVGVLGRNIYFGQ